MADPPRAASAPSIAACRAAGITPIMITGDHPLTAAAIARRIGMLRDGGRILTGAELEALDDAAFDAIVADVAVYARTNPEQKLRIVDAWRRRGAVVAMTGDGVNDAPALKRADIGVAMGITGTEVSKEAADMVLADDDFATIVAAVEEGRRIYDNIRRFVRYLLTTNSAEIWVMVLAPFLGLPVPARRRPDPLDQPRHRRPAGARPRRRAGRAPGRCAGRRVRRPSRSSRAACGSTRSGSGCSWPA